VINPGAKTTGDGAHSLGCAARAINQVSLSATLVTPCCAMDPPLPGDYRPADPAALLSVAER